MFNRKISGDFKVSKVACLFGCRNSHPSAMTTKERQPVTWILQLVAPTGCRVDDSVQLCGYWEVFGAFAMWVSVWVPRAGVPGVGGSGGSGMS